ncbi:hypothetical protein M885DRAFT_618903 [Pelagophyceae sp. CCMP2097]|nr:hypothetical protein M885DRAFT_618903 [Pelagophyceae sp. CCMP2097]
MSLRKVGPEASFGLREDVPLNRVVPLNADALDDAAAAPAGGPPGPAGLLGGRVAAVSPEGDVNEGLQRADNARVHPVDEAVRGARVRPKWTDARRVAPAGGPMDCAVASQLRCAQWEAESRSFGARLAWLEKFWLVVDRLQVFAIIWLCSQTWPWPTIWLEWTRGVAAINLDFASLGQLGAGSGSTGALGRSVYGQIPDFITNLALPIIALALAALAGDAALRSQQARAKVAELDAFASRAWRMRLRSVAANGCLRIAMLLYAPTLIAAVRLLRCEAPRNGRLEHSRLAADPAVKCDSWFLLYAQCILLPFAAAVALLLPRLLRRRCFEACTYDEALDHEKSVQLAELEDVFGVDDGDALSLFEKNGGHDGVWASKAEAQADAGVYGRSDSEWRCSDLWLVAPFKRSCATREADSLIRKCLLVASFGLFGGQPRTQGVATFFIVVLWGAPDLYRLGPYRNPSTNAIFLASEVAAFGNGLYAMLTAWGLRDAFVMPRQQTLGLISLNGSATLAICTICLYTKFTRPESPAARSLSRIVSEHGASTVVAWVNATRSARAAAMR